MSPQEVGWRLQDAGRDLVDRGRFRLRLHPGATTVPAIPEPSFRVTAAPVGAWAGADRAKFEELANKAKAGCPASKVLNAKITLDAALVN